MKSLCRPRSSRVQLVIYTFREWASYEAFSMPQVLCREKFKGCKVNSNKRRTWLKKYSSLWLYFSEYYWKFMKLPLKECVTRVMILSHAKRQIQIFNQFQAIVRHHKQNSSRNYFLWASTVIWERDDKEIKIINIVKLDKKAFGFLSQDGKNFATSRCLVTHSCIPFEVVKFDMKTIWAPISINFRAFSLDENTIWTFYRAFVNF